MKNNTKELINELKFNNEDFEWYPTTKEIIKYIYKDIICRNDISINLLDIGAGNGKLFDILEELNKDNIKKLDKITDYHKKRCIEYFNINKYAIEKSKILIDNMNKDIFIIGTDFYEQSLIDKKMDIIFCNPPYTEYVEFTKKILNEANCKYIYLVIPTRWVDNKEIKSIIENRRLEYTILNEFDFIKSEDRKARATVNLIRFDLQINYKDNPFNIWFENNFKINADKTDDSYKKDRIKREKLTEIISKNSFIKDTVLFYTQDLKKLLNNYKSLENLDNDILEELNVNKQSLIDGLEKKIEGLKNLYWQFIFENLDTITSRLTVLSRKKLLDILFKNTNIDLTESNIYSVIIWLIKNSNDFIDKQLIEVYNRFANKDNIKLYKSNKRIIEDNWRYLSDKITHYYLEYRLIVSCYTTFSDSYLYNKINGLSLEAYNFIKDVFTIAINLGFNLNLEVLSNIKWLPSKTEIFYYKNHYNSGIFVELKIYKNGNIHFKFCKEFIKKLNIEASRINKWVKNPKDIINEIDITENEFNNYYKCNFNFTKSNIKLLSDNQE